MVKGNEGGRCEREGEAVLEGEPVPELREERHPYNSSHSVMSRASSESYGGIASACIHDAASRDNPHASEG